MTRLLIERLFFVFPSSKSEKGISLQGEDLSPLQMEDIFSKAVHFTALPLLLRVF